MPAAIEKAAAGPGEVEETKGAEVPQKAREIEPEIEPAKVPEQPTEGRHQLLTALLSHKSQEQRQRARELLVRVHAYAEEEFAGTTRLWASNHRRR